jgi:hypothetical protein
MTGNTPSRRVTSLGPGQAATNSHGTKDLCKLYDKKAGAMPVSYQRSVVFISSRPWHNALPSRCDIAPAFEKGIFKKDHDRPTFATPHRLSRIGSKNCPRNLRNVHRIFQLLRLCPSRCSHLAKRERYSPPADFTFGRMVHAERFRDSASDLRVSHHSDSHQFH